MIFELTPTSMVFPHESVCVCVVVCVWLCVRVSVSAFACTNFFMKVPPSRYAF